MVWKMLLLGVVQGLSEFLPVSSSGHLVFAKHLLGFKEAGMAGVVFLHLGTLVALIVFFARRIWGIIRSLFVAGEERRMNLRLILLIVIASVPAALVGLLARGPIEEIFSEPLYVPFFLLGTGVLLLLTRWGMDRNRSLGISDAILIGIAQAVAILPGFSRSGLTIATALLLGIGSAEAFEFSFLLSIPAILAANVLEFTRLAKELSELSKLHPAANLADLFAIANLPGPLTLIMGVVVSFGVGFLALWLLKKAVVSKKFWLFSFYCFAVGVASLVLLLVFR